MQLYIYKYISIYIYIFFNLYTFDITSKLIIIPTNVFIHGKLFLCNVKIIKSAQVMKYDGVVTRFINARTLLDHLNGKWFNTKYRFNAD